MLLSNLIFGNGNSGSLFWRPWINLLFSGINPYSMLTGDNLRLIRNWKGMVQKQAASLLDMSQPGYSKLEKKKEIHGRLKERIKEAFKCTDADIDRIKNLSYPLAIYE